MSRNFDILRREAMRAAELDPHPIGRPRVVAEHRKSHADLLEDEMAKLVQQLFVLPEDQRALRVAGFCAVDQDAGCTWLCARAAEALANQFPGRVCVVDAKLRAPSLHEQFGMTNNRGLADAMRSAAPLREFVRSSWNNRLCFLFAGHAEGESHGVLNATRLQVRFTELRAEFDYVLVDAPSPGSHADALLLGRFTDGVILVVGWTSTRRDAARAAKEILKAAKVPLLGAVLNQRKYPIPEALYQRL